MFRNKICFYSEELLAPRPTPKLEDYPFSAVRNYLFNIFAATLHTEGPFLHPQLEDVPCRDDRDPLITAYLGLCLKLRHIHKYNWNIHFKVNKIIYFI